MESLLVGVAAPPRTSLRLDLGLLIRSRAKVVERRMHLKGSHIPASIPKLLPDEVIQAGGRLLASSFPVAKPDCSVEAKR